MFQIPLGKFGSGIDARRARLIESGRTGTPAAVVDASAAPVAGSIDLGFLWRGKWWIAASVAVALALCIVADSVLTPKYRAIAQILIGPVDLRVVEKDVMPLAQTADANVIQVESETRVLTSDKVLLRVIDAEQLASDPEFRPPPSAFGEVVAAVLAPFRSSPGRPEPDPQIAVLREDTQLGVNKL
jgi:uncharacterized protein involved in exopolysaccharide biosynthesis